MNDDLSWDELLSQYEKLFDKITSNNKPNINISISNAKPGVHSVYAPNGDLIVVRVSEDGDVSIV